MNVLFVASRFQCKILAFLRGERLPPFSHCSACPSTFKLIVGNFSFLFKFTLKRQGKTIDFIMTKSLFGTTVAAKI